MRTYIGPIGYNPTSINRPILSHGLDDGDHVVLVRPEDETDDRRATETLTDVERTLGALEPEIALTIERIPFTDFHAAILSCVSLILGTENDRILLLGGGARDVLVPLTIAGVAVHDCIKLVLTFSDIDGAVREITLPNLTGSVSQTMLATLDVIAELNGVSLSQITEETGHSKSTVTRHVTHLENHGFLETWPDGRTKRARITTSGQLLLESRKNTQ